MKILLTHTYFLDEDPLEKKVMKPYPPLGILYLAAWLKQNGKNVSVFDTTFSSRDKMYAKISDKKPDILGIHCNMMTKFVVLELIDFCKKNNIVSILGGPDAATQSKEFLEYGADYIVSGEGEETLMQLIDVLEKKQLDNLIYIPNISFKDKNGTIKVTETIPSRKALDEFPFPDREAIDLNIYLDCWENNHEQRSLSIVTARGCAFTCKWCSHSVYGFTHRRRKPAKVIEELESLIPKYHPTHLWYVDDVFTVNKHWLKHFNRLLKEHQIHLPFECIARADRFDEEIAEILKEMGCYRIWFGAESGSQRILDAMTRGVEKAQIENAVKVCRSASIESGLFVMFGYPGESISDINETVKFISEIQPDHYLTTVAYPLRGTKLYEEQQNNIILSENWKNTLQRNLDLKNRYSPELYQTAILKLASEYGKRKTNASLKEIIKYFYYSLRSVYCTMRIYQLRNAVT